MDAGDADYLNPYSTENRKDMKRGAMYPCSAMRNKTMKVSCKAKTKAVKKNSSPKRVKAMKVQKVMRIMKKVTAMKLR